MAKENSITQQSILFGIIGLLLGIVLALLFARNAVNNNMGGMMRMMGMNLRSESMMNDDEAQGMHGEEVGISMNEMTASLRGKTDDDFDKEFTNLMIEHHQGAIDMASLAKQNAKHQEIKDLADNIVSAQMSEIKMMREWQKSWGY